MPSWDRSDKLRLPFLLEALCWRQGGRRQMLGLQPWPRQGGDCSRSMWHCPWLLQLAGYQYASVPHRCFSCGCGVPRWDDPHRMFVLLSLVSLCRRPGKRQCMRCLQCPWRERCLCAGALRHHATPDSDLDRHDHHHNHCRTRMDDAVLPQEYSGW